MSIDILKFHFDNGKHAEFWELNFLRDERYLYFNKAVILICGFLEVNSGSSVLSMLDVYLGGRVLV